MHYCAQEDVLLYKEEVMKKVALVIALLVLFASVAGAVVPDDKDFRTGLKAYNSKNYKAAVKYFKEYISRKPDPTAYYLTGYSLYKLGKFSEADDYFKDAYLIDPEYSLEKVGLIKQTSGEVVAKEAADLKKPEPALEKKEAKPAPAETKTGQPIKETQPVAKAAQPAPADAKAAKPGPTAPADQKAKPAEPPAPAAAQKPATTAPAAPQKAAPAVPAPSAPPVAPNPMPKGMPGAAAPGALIGIIAAFGMIIVLIGLAVYLYYSLCLFLIAKKLAVPAPWTAWIPIVQAWTFVMSAGKPGWWVVLFLVPIVNLFLGIYLWMCVTENLGKNKWLGLLILVPLVGIIYPGWLAFSKSEHSGGYMPPPEETLPE